MIRVIKVSSGQISEHQFSESFYTQDFEATELESFIKSKNYGEFLGIEIRDAHEKDGGKNEPPREPCEECPTAVKASLLKLRGDERRWQDVPLYYCPVCGRKLK
jgi:hypothetical protein